MHPRPSLSIALFTLIALFTTGCLAARPADPDEAIAAPATRQQDGPAPAGATAPALAPSPDTPSARSSSLLDSALSNSSSRPYSCSGYSCCGAGQWMRGPLGGCGQVAPPYCGCYCTGTPPTLYSSKEACEAAK